jgi:hypothetical protein
LNPHIIYVQQPAIIPHLSDVEKQHFEYFQVVSTEEFSNYFESELWQRIVLRAACTEPCIRHAVLAIGTLGRTRSAPSTSGLEYHTNFGSEYSTKQYNLAIQTLNYSLNSSNRSWELAVLASIVFIAIEVLQGHDDMVRMHLRSAFAILKNSTTFQCGTDLAHLFSAFSRLDVQSSSFAHLHYVMSVQMPVLPSRFQSIDEARESLNAITSAMYSTFGRRSPGYLRPLYPAPSPELTHDLSTILSLLITWHTRITTYTTHHLITDPKTIASIQILHIRHLVAYVQISTYTYHSESAYDTHFPQFTQIVDLATRVLSADEAYPVSLHSVPCRILDIGMVQPLYFVVRKCRDGLLRRKAISIMEKVRKERVHDLRLLVRVARWIVSVEEEGWMADERLPEEKRLSEVELEFDDVASMCGILAWRRLRDGSREDISGLIRT